MDQNIFLRRVWIATATVALFAVILLLIKATFNILLLVLAGALIAVFFRSIAGLLQRKLHWKSSVSILTSVIGTLLLTVMLFWLIGAKVESQAEQLSESLPNTLQTAREKLNHSALGSRLMDKLSQTNTQSKIKSVAATLFKSSFGMLGDIYVVLFLGIFFTASPRLYTHGILSLIPGNAQPKAKEVMDKVSANLSKWLKGKIFAMLVVTILTAIGLVIIGVPMWLALAVIAGLLNFIPNFGPLIALIPASLVAFADGPVTAAWVIGLYIVVQVVESNFITPMVQKRLVNIPPAMIIIAQLLIAPFSGGWGLIVATPLLLIIMTVTQELYTKRHRNI